MPSPWTHPGDVRSALRRKWESGALLTRFAAGQDWEPLVFPLRGPAASMIGERLGEVQEWAKEWEQAGRGPLRVDYKKVGGRHIGTNMIPCRAWIDGYDQAWALLGVDAEVGRFANLAEQTLASCPRVQGWLARLPGDGDVLGRQPGAEPQRDVDRGRRLLDHDVDVPLAVDGKVGALPGPRAAWAPREVEAGGHVRVARQ